MGMVRTMVQPLGIASLERELVEDGDAATAVLASLFRESRTPVQDVTRRYRQVTDHCDEPRLVPMHDVIVRHVIRPLSEAKRCYVLGMPVACIAQAGLVGEMVALWRFRMILAEMSSLPEDRRTELPALDAFDRMGQQGRVSTLREIEQLDPDLVSAFGELRGIRREYMHFMVGDKKNPDRDALKAMKFATSLVVKTLGMDIRNGMMHFPAQVTHFIRDMIQQDEAG